MTPESISGFPSPDSSPSSGGWRGRPRCLSCGVSSSGVDASSQPSEDEDDNEEQEAEGAAAQVDTLATSLDASRDHSQEPRRLCHYWQSRMLSLRSTTRPST